MRPADPGTAWMGQTGQSSQPLPAGTYSSMADALEAAADGDVIQLLPGTHVVSQVSVGSTEIKPSILLASCGVSCAEYMWCSICK